MVARRWATGHYNTCRVSVWQLADGRLGPGCLTCHRGPVSSLVQTVTGPVRAADPGRTLMHEHLTVGYPGFEAHTSRPGPTWSPSAWSGSDNSRNWGGNPNPIMAGYVESFEVLTSPAQKEDYDYHGPPIINANSINSITQGRPVKPKPPANQFEVIDYNISYLYLAGLRAVEPAVVKPVPLWGTETVGPDIGTRAWYGAGNGSGSNSLATSADTLPGYYSKYDTYGEDGANFVFSDGHAEFLPNEQSYRGETYSIHEFFFGAAGDAGVNKNAQNINAIKKNRSTMLQTID